MDGFIKPKTGDGCADEFLVALEVQQVLVRCTRNHPVLVLGEKLFQIV